MYLRASVSSDLKALYKSVIIIIIIIIIYCHYDEKLYHKQVYEI